MRVILAAIAIVLIVAGILLALNWMQIDNSDGRTTITIDTEKVEETGDKLKQEGREALRDTGEALQRAGSGEAADGDPDT
jgi:hypothetical protein